MYETFDIPVNEIASIGKKLGDCDFMNIFKI